MAENSRIFLNQIIFPVRWSDMDAYQHINNSKYFDYMSEARCVLLEDFMQYSQQCQFVVAHTSCNFKQPFAYPDTIILNQYCDQIGGSSFILYYEFFNEKNPQSLCADGIAKMVCFDPKKKSVCKIPEGLKTLFTIR